MPPTRIRPTIAERTRRREERRIADQGLDDLTVAVEALCKIDPRAFRPGSLAKSITRLEDFALTIKRLHEWEG
jgi:hypothetical protein